MTGIADVLREHEADSETIQRALLLYLADRTELSPPEMIAEMRAAAVDPERLDAELVRLAADPYLLDNAALWTLSDAWADPDERETVTTMVAEAGNKLALAETLVIASSAAYGLYLIITRGRKHEVTRTRREPDGKLVEYREVTYVDPTSMFTELIRLFRVGDPGQPEIRPDQDEPPLS